MACFRGLRTSCTTPRSGVCVPGSVRRFVPGAEAQLLTPRAVGHMPFGKPDALRTQSSYAYQIFHRYRHTIAAHFYGHSHVDEFEIGYSDYEDRRSDTAEQISFIAGAVTPQSASSQLVTFAVADTLAQVATPSSASTTLTQRHTRCGTLRLISRTAASRRSRSIPTGGVTTRRERCMGLCSTHLCAAMSLWGRRSGIA